MIIYRLDISVVELNPGEYGIQIGGAKNSGNEKALFDACRVPEEEREKVLDEAENAFRNTFLDEIAKRSTEGVVRINDIQNKEEK